MLGASQLPPATSGWQASLCPPPAFALPLLSEAVPKAQAPSSSGFLLDFANRSQIEEGGRGRKLGLPWVLPCQPSVGWQWLCSSAEGRGSFPAVLSHKLLFFRCSCPLGILERGSEGVLPILEFYFQEIRKIFSFNSPSI